MSQTAESARDWIRSATPDIDQLQQAANALSRKLREHPNLDANSRQNLQQALQVVLEEVEAQKYAREDDTQGEAQLETNSSITLDTGALGESKNAVELDLTPLGESADPAIQPLDGSAKRAAFEALKQQIK